MSELENHMRLAWLAYMSLSLDNLLEERDGIQWVAVLSNWWYTEINKRTTEDSLTHHQYPRGIDHYIEQRIGDPSFFGFIPGTIGPGELRSRGMVEKAKGYDLNIIDIAPYIAVVYK